MKKLVAVVVVLSMMIGSVGIMNSFDTTEKSTLLSWDTNYTTQHDPAPGTI